MLGVPSRPDAVGFAALLLGVLLGAICAWRLRRRRLEPSRVEFHAALALLLITAAAPYLVWRIVADLRVTTRMTAYDRSVAGPVQAFLQPYLLDSVVRIIPRDETYATVVGGSVPYHTARLAFPSLAVQVLSPRISTSVSRADWIVAWGSDPRSIAPVARVIVARRASGVYPAVFVARVRR